MPHPIATRSGQPAHLKAPPRLTQSMADLQRQISAHRSHSRQPEDDADQGSLLAWFIGGAVVTAVVLLAVTL